MTNWKRWTLCAQLAIGFAAGAEPVTIEQPETSRNNEVVIQLSAGGQTGVALSAEHRFGSVGLWLGVGGALSSGGFGTEIAVALEPGARLYLPGAHGLWLGAGVPIGYSRLSFSSFLQRSWTVGLTPALGFSHVFESGLVVQLYAGPDLQLGWSDGQVGVGGLGGLGGPGNLVSLWLRAGVGVG